MAHLTSLCLFFLFTFILAAPLDTRTVYVPPILSPTADSVWTVGQVETVTWNATGIPAGVTGSIRLGYLTPDSEHLSVTLASGFNLTDEKVNVTVPPVVGRTNYIVVLFGDSGNISPQFTIQGLNGTSVSSAGTSSKLSSSDTPATTSKNAGVSVTPSPPIATFSSSIPVPSPSVTAPSSSSALGSSSSSLPTSSSPVTSPTPSPSNNAGRSTNKPFSYQVLLAPAALLLIL